MTFNKVHSDSLLRVSIDMTYDVMPGNASNNCNSWELLLNGKSCSPVPVKYVVYSTQTGSYARTGNRKW